MAEEEISQRYDRQNVRPGKARGTLTAPSSIRTPNSQLCQFPADVLTKCSDLLCTHNTVVRRITTFRSTTDRIYDGGPIIYFSMYNS